ncbi:MAG: S-layer homology domain-containing protein, partial [Clostridia bacterium]|nr:S-layer homology domain-containing protein [Clostridia bacterium]
MKKFLKLSMMVMLVFILSSTMVYSFSDTSDKNIDFLTGKGIITGYEDGSFKPENPISRAEFSTVMCRALELVDYAQTLKNEQMFADV